MLCIKSLNSFKIITICSKKLIHTKSKKTVAKIKENIKKKSLFGFEIDEALQHATTPSTNNFFAQCEENKRIHPLLGFRGSQQ